MLFSLLKPSRKSSSRSLRIIFFLSFFFSNASVVLVLDLSQPQELWQTYQTLYDAIAKRVKFCISEASKQNPNLKEKLKESILKRIGKAVC